MTTDLQHSWKSTVEPNVYALQRCADLVTRIADAWEIFVRALFEDCSIPTGRQ